VLVPENIVALNVFVKGLYERPGLSKYGIELTPAAETNTG
jgi:hypothetical protein